MTSMVLCFDIMLGMDLEYDIGLVIEDEMFYFDLADNLGNLNL